MFHGRSAVAGHPLEKIHQGIHLVAGIVKGKGRPDRALGAEVTHGRQGAVVPGPDSDAVIVEIFGNILIGNSRDDKGKNTRFFGRRCQ